MPTSAVIIFCRAAPFARNAGRMISRPGLLQAMAKSSASPSIAATYHKAIPAPYVVALIELKEGPRLISNVVGCAPEDVSIGMKVQVKFETEDGFMLPRFALVNSTLSSEV